MLAKVIAWAPTRLAAARRLASALERARIHGPATNRALLVSVLRDPRFGAGQADTGLLDGYDLGAWSPATRPYGSRRSPRRWPVRRGPGRGAGAGRAAARLAQRGLTAAARLVHGPRGRAEVAYLWRREHITVVPEEEGGTARPRRPRA